MLDESTCSGPSRLLKRLLDRADGSAGGHRQLWPRSAAEYESRASLRLQKFCCQAEAEAESVVVERTRYIFKSGMAKPSSKSRSKTVLGVAVVFSSEQPPRWSSAVLPTLCYTLMPAHVCAVAEMKPRQSKEIFKLAELHEHVLI